MKKLLVVPIEWPIPLGECTPGFFLHDKKLCFKSEYGDVYCETGEYFWGGAETTTERDAIEVQPVDAKWVDESSHQ